MRKPDAGSREAEGWKMEARLWRLSSSESQVDRGEAEPEGEAETRKEKPEETGSRRSECGSASEGTARSGEKPRRTDGRTGREHQASANVRIASEDFCIVLRNRESEDSVRKFSTGQRIDRSKGRLEAG